MAEKRGYLECEKQWVFRLLMLVAGFYGGYTLVVRGGVFSNAQTGNLALFAVAVGKGNWSDALYYLIPMAGYVLGSVFAEILPKFFRRSHLIRWDTALTLFEIIMVIIMGFIPSTAPHQICQIIVNFICALQYNTFRQAEGIAMATTFCTNHIRQLGTNVVRMWKPGQEGTEARRRAWAHTAMVLCFMAGVAAATVACRFLEVKAIWIALIPLLILFIDLLHADRTKEKDLLEVSPSGH